MARRPPARERQRALDRPVLVPARDEPAAQLRRVAVRAPLLAGRGRLRAGGRVEPAHPLLVRGRRTVHARLAAAARVGTGSGARRRSRVRARAVSRGAEHGALPRTDLDPAAARALRVRAVAEGKPLVGRPGRGGARLDSVLRRAPRARGSAVLPPLRRPADAAPAARDGCGDPCGRGRRRRRGARRVADDSRLDHRRRAEPGGGGAVLGVRARPGHAARAHRPRELRVPRVADATARDRRLRGADLDAAVRAVRRARARRAHPRPARPGDAPAALLDALAPLPAAPLPARARATDAGRRPVHRRARGLRRLEGAVARDRPGDRRRRALLRPARAALPGPPGRREQPGVRRAARRAGGTARGAARVPTRAERRERLPLLRHAGLAGAAGRILDRRAEVGRRHGPAPAAAQLRRLERPPEGAGQARRPLRRRPHGPVRRETSRSSPDACSRRCAAF